MGELVSEMEWPEGPFDVIYADPPWHYDNSTPRGGVLHHYSTMTVEELMDLPVMGLTSETSTLFLWATNPKLIEALQVVLSWGFTYKTNLVWVKDKIGNGYWVRGQHELLLIATRGNPSPPEPAKRPSSVFHSKRRKHSQKPDSIRDLIGRMRPGATCVELFARQTAPGWAVWGAEAPAEPDPVLFL